MTNIIDFPGNPDPDYDIETQLSVLVYKWWMQDFYPMFVEGGKLLRSYMVYGELFSAVMHLHADGYVEIIESEDGAMGLAMDPRLSQMIFETMNGAYNMARSDEEINNEDSTDEQLH
jgi:hypothetical protein